MKLYVIRHSLPDYGDDPENVPGDPPLSEDGREFVENLAQWMLDNDETPNFIFTSPKLRTQETAEIIREAIGLSSVKVDPSIDSHMSIKKLVEKVAGDEAMTRVAIVSHHESIEHGLRVLNLEPWIHLDMLAMSEMRILDVKRKKFTWKEEARVVPSDLGGEDIY